MYPRVAREATSVGIHDTALWLQYQSHSQANKEMKDNCEVESSSPIWWKLLSYTRDLGE